MPKKENRLSSIRSGLTQSINTRKPAWRSQASYVRNLMKQGYQEDPNKLNYEVYNEVEFQNIVDFVEKDVIESLKSGSEKFDFGLAPSRWLSFPSFIASNKSRSLSTN